MPTYVRQTRNDLTGEHTTIMLKLLQTAATSTDWLAAFYTDFRLVTTRSSVSVLTDLLTKWTKVSWMTRSRLSQSSSRVIPVTLLSVAFLATWPLGLLDMISKTMTSVLSLSVIVQGKSVFILI